MKRVSVSVALLLSSSGGAQLMIVDTLAVTEVEQEPKTRKANAVTRQGCTR
jgi:hypothetical protein